MVTSLLRERGRTSDLPTKLLLDSDGEPGEVLIADDLAGLALDFEHPGGRPARAHAATCQPAGHRVVGRRGGRLGNMAVRTLTRFAEPLAHFRFRLGTSVSELPGLAAALDEIRA
jgi:hypothetical protein